MTSEQRDRLDHLLDHALATYVDPGAQPGLESRVFRRVRAADVETRWSLRHWAPVAALGCLLAGVAVWHNRTLPPAPAGMVLNNASPRPEIAVNTQSSKSPIGPAHKHPDAIPKQAEFPIRAALTHQERALVAFARSAPEEALRTFGEMKPIEIEPLRIDKIQIQPLAESVLKQN